MPISVARIRSDIEAIARCTATPGNGATRPTFSPAWAEARAYVIAQAEAAGCVVRTDAAGNVHARPAGLGWDEPAWLVGSHIDSVPHGGDYDGVAGVVVGLELLRSAKDDGVAPLAVELIVFAEEEGPTFGLGMLGSRAWVGELSAEQLGGLKNSAGQTYLEAGTPFGVDPAKLAADRLDRSRYLGLIEAHIEQGPGMWRRDQRLAVVTAIAGRRQMTVTIRGEANHAGATAMTDRRDALAGAAACMVGLELLARDTGHGAVLTVGRLANHPNAINVVPDRVEFTIDFRSGDSGTVVEFYFSIRGLIEDTCRRRGLACDVLSSEHIDARPMDARLVAALVSAGGGLTTTVSGALHDSAILAPHLPTVMLFVPSRDGISHNPAEFSRVEDVAGAAAVVERLVRRPTPDRLSAMSRDAFVAAVGHVFEHSPWIAGRTWESGRPFSSLADLHEKLCRSVAAATPDEQVALIRAHPDLVGRLAREGRLTRESTAEQAAAGLSALTAEEVEAFERHNAAYRARFGFPFVICARENRKEAILAAFPRRLQNGPEQEVATALGEIYKIARLRLADAVWQE
ncbi:MAG TPA: 2-oxo-4-hydroxy-4-carboxy-5-ureidoimidazoline decarboxylase [Humisphaera sp.]